MLVCVSAATLPTVIVSTEISISSDCQSIAPLRSHGRRARRSRSVV